MSLEVVAVESIIQNVLDVCVVFLIALLDSKYTVCECFMCKTMRLQSCSLCNTIQTDHHILNLSFVCTCKIMMEIHTKASYGG
jgi:hypothetical protein